jgi:hypothetical protein
LSVGGAFSGAGGEVVFSLVIGGWGVGAFLRATFVGFVSACAGEISFAVAGSAALRGARFAAFFAGVMVSSITGVFAIFAVLRAVLRGATMLLSGVSVVSLMRFLGKRGLGVEFCHDGIGQFKISKYV